ncbi:MAG: U32 family peptidase [Candidatus Dadabacteria bacterium]|nr:MAG: U32 family peptidase [Candidatus Dadabacteria bacterium]
MANNTIPKTKIKALFRMPLLFCLRTLKSINLTDKKRIITGMISSKGKPELLAPAGNLQKLKTAILYGADAVYFSGQRYGLRAAADNFTDFELCEAIDFCHRYGAKAYITINAYLQDEDLEGLEDFCKFLASHKADGVVVSDPGVASLVKGCSDLKLHLSTQVSCLNTDAAILWKEMGIERIILGREVSISDAAEIKRLTGLEVEIFIHGSMCSSYSGFCTISNYTAGRDSNRGGCVHSCRFKYEVKPLQGETTTTHFMSSKDMIGIEHVKEAATLGIDSLKIEGRMRSALYIATACKAYRRVIDSVMENTEALEALNTALRELNSFPHRDYYSNPFDGKVSQDSIYYDGTPTIKNATSSYAGVVIDCSEKLAAIKLYQKVSTGDALEVVHPKASPFKFKASNMLNILNEPIDTAQQDTIVKVPSSLLQDAAIPNVVLRKPERG